MNYIKTNFYLVLIFMFGCSQIFEDSSFSINDTDNNGYDDRDYNFLEKLIENSQGNALSPPSDLKPEDLGEQIWVDGRLRSLKHIGGIYYLYGEIPTEIKDVEYLNKLVLSDNFLTSIPEEIGELKRLSEIILNDNRFIGEIPEGLWENKLNLKNLSIFNNYFNSMPESICNYYNDISHFIFSHNNLCDIPDCISNSGIQSCECEDYITMEICMDEGIESECIRSLDNLIDNCPLKDYWGETLYQNLKDFNGNYCVDWDSGYSCEMIYTINGDSVNFALDIEQGCIDCNGNDCTDSFSWIGDGSCDESSGLNFSCPEFNCDMNDCGFYSENLSECFCTRDCSGTCFDNAFCGVAYAIYGYDCCVLDDSCEDVTGDGNIQSGIGDGWCDNGSRGLNFSCGVVGDYDFDCDGGDCGIFNPETGECEPAAGQVIRYFDDEFYPQSFLND